MFLLPTSALSWSLHSTAQGLAARVPEIYSMSPLAGGWRFSREEVRSHVHVQHATGEAKFWLEPEVELAADYGIGPTRISAARKIIEMKSAQRGQNTSVVEVANVSPSGFWLLVEDRERFVPFKDFPWFRDATIAELTHVLLPSPYHLCWPALDIDLALESRRAERVSGHEYAGRAFAAEAPSR